MLASPGDAVKSTRDASRYMSDKIIRVLVCVRCDMPLNLADKVEIRPILSALSCLRHHNRPEFCAINLFFILVALACVGWDLS